MGVRGVRGEGRGRRPASYIPLPIMFGCIEMTYYRSLACCGPAFSFKPKLIQGREVTFPWCNTPAEFDNTTQNFLHKKKTKEMYLLYSSNMAHCVPSLHLGNRVLLIDDQQCSAEELPTMPEAPGTGHGLGIMKRTTVI